MFEGGDDQILVSRPIDPINEKNKYFLRTKEIFYKKNLDSIAKEDCFLRSIYITSTPKYFTSV